MCFCMHLEKDILEVHARAHDDSFKGWVMGVPHVCMLTCFNEEMLGLGGKSRELDLPEPRRCPVGHLEGSKDVRSGVGEVVWVSR